MADTEIKDIGGSVVATRSGDGTVRGASGEPIASVRTRRGSRPDRPLECALDVTDPSGGPLATATVAKFKFTPRSKTLSVAVADAGGAEAARFEHDGSERVDIVAGGSSVGTLSIETVKKGFLRRERVYTLDLAGELAEPTRTLVVAVAAGYEALGQEVQGAAMRD